MGVFDSDLYLVKNVVKKAEETISRIHEKLKKVQLAWLVMSLRFVLEIQRECF